MNILVTGGAGLIGSNLVKKLVSFGHIVYVADNLWRGKIQNLYEGEKPIIDLEKQFFQVDLRDKEKCLEVTRNMDVVYHLADIVAGINFVFSNELFLYHANVLMNTYMLNAAIKNNVEKYIYVGTACSFPAEKQMVLDPPPFKEEDVYPASPESSYGWSKLMGEYECELALKEKLIDIGILRLHNVYGPPCELNPEKSQVIPALCRKALMYPEEPFEVWGSGNQKRAFVYVDDIIDALIAVAKFGMNKGAIQIGPGESVSIADIAKKIAEISGKSIDIEFDISKPEGDVDRCADWSKAKKILGWEPKIGIDMGLKLTYQWCKEFLSNNKLNNNA